MPAPPGGSGGCHGRHRPARFRLGPDRPSPADYNPAPRARARAHTIGSMDAPATAQLIALRYEHGCLFALDQTRLPADEVVLELRSAAEVGAAIKRLSIRGAPLIGIAGA